ncbi:MAG: hypothetical protein QOG71_3912 [Pyrinomonadaceae bacterium]|nr:hypothetical protein [Pyrinomonadaceae bacterium]
MKLSFIKASPFGSTSFLIPLGIIVASVIVLSFSLAGVEDSAHDEHFASAMLILAVFGAVALFAACGALVGFVLSIIGLVRKEERRVFSILGFVLNGAILLMGSFILFRNFEF